MAEGPDAADGEFLASGVFSKDASTAQALRAQGRPDEALAFIAGLAWHADEKLAVLFFRILHELESYAALQGAVGEAIAALPEQAAASENFLRLLVHYATLACLPSARIGALLDFIQARGGARGVLERPVLAARHRLRFREQARRPSRALNLVSLGLNCLPWSLLNRWGLRSAAQFAAGPTPFNLAVHRLEGVIEALESDFAGYADPDAIVTIKTASGHQVAMRKDRGALWNHQEGPYWLGDGYLRLLAGLAAKIENFRACCAAETPIFMLSNAPGEALQRDVELRTRLQAGLARMTGRADNRLILSSQLAQKGEGEDFQLLDAGTVFFRHPAPDKNYVWHLAENFNSPQGLAYERGYMRLTLRSLAHWRLLAPREGAVSGGEAA